MVKYILLFFGFILGICLITFGFYTWGTPADGCDAYLDLGIEVSEAIALQEDCNDDITLGWATMITGIILVIGTKIIAIVAFIYDVRKDNAKDSSGGVPQTPKE